MKHRRQRLAMFPLVCLLLIGCGTGPRLVPVSGTVTLDGEPVDQVRVVFEPVIGEADVTTDVYYSSFGITDDHGHFEMKTEVEGEVRPGALAGGHTVRFSSLKVETFMNKGVEDQRAVHQLPPETRDNSMRFTVPEGGTPEANFDL